MADSSGTSSPLQLLHDVGLILDSEGVRWAAIGALAVAYHGWVRASMDADALITLQGASIDLDTLAVRLRKAGWTAEVRVGDSDDPLGFVVRIEDGAANQVDLIGEIRGLDLRLFDRLIEDGLEGLPLKIASAEDLVALKIFAGSPRDLQDAAELVEAQGSSLDRKVLLDLCRQLGSEAEGRCRDLLNS